jgi:hypothetical protein
MPAKSEAQRRMMAIVEHHPEQLYERNKGAAKMSKQSLHDFASTSEKGLPKHTASKRKLKKGQFKKGGYDWKDYD